MTVQTLLILSIFPMGMLVAAFSDLFSMTIPNRIPAALCGLFLLLAPFLGYGWETLGLHVAVALGMLVLGILCFAAGWMGGGDAKLLTAIALWLGPGPLLMEFAVGSAILGGVLTLGLLNLRATVQPVTNIVFIDRLLEPTTGVPYGIALGVAGLWIFPSTPFFDAAIRLSSGG